MQKSFLLFLSIFCCSSPIAQGKETSAMSTFLFQEGAFVLSSYLASEYPQETGALITVLSPLGASPSATETTNYVAVGGMMTIGLYNAIELKDDSYSKSDVFKRNMIGWHVFATSLWLSEKITGQRKTITFLAPLNDGAVLTVNHRF